MKLSKSERRTLLALLSRAIENDQISLMRWEGAATIAIADIFGCGTDGQRVSVILSESQFQTFAEPLGDRKEAEL